jgi:hypothetical protein
MTLHASTTLALRRQSQSQASPSARSIENSIPAASNTGGIVAIAPRASPAFGKMSARQRVERERIPSISDGVTQVMTPDVESAFTM